MIPKTAIIGATGFVGRSFADAYRKRYSDCVTTTRRDIDLSHPNIVPFQLFKSGHRAAIITAAITDISTCEKNPDETYLVNVTGTLELIRQLHGEGILPVFPSTDYVFDGEKGSYTEDSPTNPKTRYGIQKVEVESKIADITGGEHLVLRYGKIYSDEKGSRTILDELASSLISGERIKAASDQIFTPTLITDLIHTVSYLLEKNIRGLFHVATPEIWSRYDLAIAMARSLNVPESLVERIELADLCLNPTRPKNTSLIPQKLEKQDAVRFTEMKTSLLKIAKQFS